MNPHRWFLGLATLCLCVALILPASCQNVKNILGLSAIFVATILGVVFLIGLPVRILSHDLPRLLSAALMDQSSSRRSGHL